MEVVNKGDPGDLRVLSSFPDRGVTEEMVESLNDSGRFERVIALAGHSRTTIRTHLLLSRNNTHYFVGWDPDNAAWILIAEVEEYEVAENEDDSPEFEFPVSILRKRDDSGTALTAPFDHIDETVDGDSARLLPALMDAVAEYGRVSYEMADERPPEFYTDHLGADSADPFGTNV